MARTNNLTNFLTDVAGAIKTKKGSQTAIQAANFDTEILALPSQGTYQEKTVTITQNGQTTLTPDTGYDAMDQVEITVNVPIKQLQSKTVSVTSNGNVSLLPDTGYDGFNEVNLQVNVPTGGGSGDVKLFETEQAMQADPNPQEDDLAIVYRDETQNWDGESEVTGFVFPSTVVLSSAATGNAYGMAEEIQMNGEVNSESAYFRIDNWSTGDEISVEYESQDGLTYTRTDSGEESITFENPVTFEVWDWSDVCGNFMQTGGKYFDGLYQYRLGVDNPTKRLLPSISKITADFQTGSIVEYDFSGEQSYLDSDKLLDAINQIATDNQLEYLDYAIFIDTGNNIHVIPMENTSSEPYRNLEY